MKTIPPHFPESNAPVMVMHATYWSTTPQQLRMLADRMEKEWNAAVKTDEFDPRGIHVLYTARNNGTIFNICVDMDRMETQPDYSARLATTSIRKHTGRAPKFVPVARNGHTTTPKSPFNCRLCEKPVGKWGKVCTGMPEGTKKKKLTHR